MTLPRHAIHRTLLCLLAVAVLSGCPIIGYFTQLVTPPPTVEPLYHFPPNVHALVLVDEPAGENGQEVRHLLTEEIRRQLRTHDVVRTVPTRKLTALRRKAGTNFARMSIAEVGKKTGAQMVLYVRVTGFSLSDSSYGDLYQGRLEMSVRVVDVEEGKVWPKDLLGGYRMKPVTTERKAPDGTDRFEHKLTEEVTHAAADRVAKLFYEHESPGGHSPMPDLDEPSHR